MRPMTLDRGRLNWGVFLIVLGAVPLAYNRGAISIDTVSDLWRFWPLVLIGLGLGIVLSRTPWAFIGGLVVAACLGLVLGSLLAVGPHVGCGPGSGPSHTFEYDGSFTASNPQVRLDLQCGSARVDTSSDERWHVHGSTNGDEPAVSSTPASLDVRQGNRNGWFINRGDDRWEVMLPPNLGSLSAKVDAGEARFSLAGATLASASFSVNAGSLNVDLSAARIESLRLSTNVGSSSLILDGSSDISGEITNNVGSTDICLPAGLGLRVSYNGNLGSENFSGAGLAIVNGAWQTAGYETAIYKANFTIKNSVGSVTLNPAGGCK